MIEVLVSQSRDGYSFSRDFCRGRIDMAGPGIFNRGQLRAVANILGVPADEDVMFVDAGTYDLLFALDA